jgi:hypothetical protein
MRALATVLLGIAVTTAPALAQKAPDYDPAAVVTVTGVVVDTHEAKARNDHPGLHFLLKIASASEEEPGAVEGGPSEPPAAGEPAAAPEPADAAEQTPVVGAEPEAVAVTEPPDAAAPEPAADEPEPAAAAAAPVLPPGTVEVHACPMDLLGYLDMAIEEGDELTVTGSRPGGGPIIVASEIVKGQVKLQVRDAAGVPIWEDLP